LKINFTKIENSIYKILNNKYSNNYIYGIPIFYIQKAHDEYLKPYINFFNQKNFLKNKKFFFKKIINHINYILLENKDFYFHNIKSNSYDIFLVSNLISESNIKNDYIYGNLYKELKKNKIKSLTIFRNFLNKPSSKVLKPQKKPIVILSKASKLLSEFSFIFEIFKTYKSLNILEKKIQSKTLKKFINFIKKLNFLLPVISNIRLAFQFEKLIKKFKPKIVIITFENHAWERFLIHKIKQIDKKIIIAGYQFTTFTKNQFSEKIILKKNFNPDYIFASGSSSFNCFKKSIDNKIKLINFGSPRDSTVVLHNNKKITNTFLLVPESPISEVNDFFLKSIDLASHNSNCKFTLRLHPMSKSIELTNYIQKKIKHIKNIKLSNQNLKDDFKNNSYIIYRSSSLSIKGAVSGLIPLYFQSNNYNLDPFFEINNFFKFRSNDEFKKIVLLNKKKKFLYQKKLLKYSKKYFENFNYKEISNFFEKKLQL
jgi:hypothetical protein